MPPLVRSWIDRARQALDGREWAGVAVALLAAAGLWLGRGLPPPYLLALAALLLVALAVLARLLLPRLLGPVFFYDLVRTTRRSRYFLLRAGYAGVLLVTLFVFYASWFGGLDLGNLLATSQVPHDQTTRFATSFFSVFIVVQLAVVFLLAPVYSAGAIAEEKERRTLEYLLTTDLSGREIVLGKLVSRLANLTLVVLAGLPVLSLVQFLGGVDPNLVLAAFAATGLTMLSVAGLGILNSVYVNRVRDAIFLTYLEVAAYLFFTGACCGWLSGGPPPLDWPAAGNIFVVVAKLREGAANNTLAQTLPAVLRDYAIFHGLAAVVCTVWAAGWLRRETRQQATGHAGAVRVRVPKGGGYVVVRRHVYRPPPLPKPRLTGDPVIWKDLYVESGLRLSQLALALAITFGGILLYLAGAVFVLGVLIALVRGSGLGEFSNAWVRVVGTPVACLTFLAVAVRAAGGFSGERERQTLDGLLTTPLEDRDILWGKWAASVLCVRKAWWGLGAVWGLGVVTGGVCPFALPLLVAAWLIYAGLAAGLGLWFSLVSPTTLRATIWTVLAVVTAGAAPALLGACFDPIFQGDTNGRVPWVADFFGWGLAPPRTLWFLAFYWDDFLPEYEKKDSWQALSAALAGLVCYAGATLALWGWLNARFGALTGRIASDVSGPLTTDH